MNPSYLFATREEQAGAGKKTRSKPVKAIRIFQGVGKPDVKLLVLMGLLILNGTLILINKMYWQITLN